MLTFVIQGETHHVKASQFRELVDVAVRILKDASRESGVEFTVGNLHSSEPTIAWAPAPKKAGVDVDAAFDQIVRRLIGGIDALEQHAGVPDWMSEATARALYDAAEKFGKGEVTGISFSRDGKQRRMTRKTFRTLDEMLFDETDSTGAVTGQLVTVTLANGPHVSLTDDVFGRTVRCYVPEPELREAGQWVGRRVTATGEVKRNFKGEALSVHRATIELVQERPQVTVADTAGLFRGGPPVAEFLREQRGG